MLRFENTPATHALTTPDGSGAQSGSRGTHMVNLNGALGWESASQGVKESGSQGVRESGRKGGREAGRQGGREAGRGLTELAVFW